MLHQILYTIVLLYFRNSQIPASSYRQNRHALPVLYHCLYSLKPFLSERTLFLLRLCSFQCKHTPADYSLHIFARSYPQSHRLPSHLMSPEPDHEAWYFLYKNRHHILLKKSSDPGSSMIYVFRSGILQHQYPCRSHRLHLIRDS